MLSYKHIVSYKYNVGYKYSLCNYKHNLFDMLKDLACYDMRSS